MNKKDFQKHHQITMQKTLTNFDDLIISNVLLQKYLAISYELTATYLSEIEGVEVNGTINYQVLITDARDGQQVVHSSEMEWNDQYLFSEFSNEELNFDNLATEQINANIPINLSYNRGTINKVGPGWQLISEDEYLFDKQNTSDPRWDKLKNISKDNHK